MGWPRGALSPSVVSPHVPPQPLFSEGLLSPSPPARAGHWDLVVACVALAWAQRRAGEAGRPSAVVVRARGPWRSWGAASAWPTQRGQQGGMSEGRLKGRGRSSGHLCAKAWRHGGPCPF